MKQLNNVLAHIGSVQNFRTDRGARRPKEVSPRIPPGLSRFPKILDATAHIYEELDLVRLYRFAAVESKDLEAFIEAVKQHLATKAFDST